MCEIIGTIKKQFLDEQIRYSMDWSDRMKPEVSAYPVVSRDRIVTSTWALAADSPMTDVTFVGSGHNDQLHVGWITLVPGATLVADDVIYLNNTIETSGIQPFGLLTDATSGQLLVRQYRIRFAEC